MATPADEIPSDDRMEVITRIAPPGIRGTVRLMATELNETTASLPQEASESPSNLQKVRRNSLSLLTPSPLSHPMREFALQ
jgi:hypothetical protein